MERPQAGGISVQQPDHAPGLYERVRPQGLHSNVRANSGNLSKITLPAAKFAAGIFSRNKFRVFFMNYPNFFIAYFGFI